VVIDLTKVAAGDAFAHGKFADSPEIVQLIGTRLLKGQAIAGSDAVADTSRVTARLFQRPALSSRRVALGAQ
jgi:esterase/lipase superfamily enzyme